MGKVLINVAFTIDVGLSKPLGFVSRLARLPNYMYLYSQDIGCIRADERLCTQKEAFVHYFIGLLHLGTANMRH